MSPETVKQYQREERALIHKRMLSEKERLNELLELMSVEKIASQSSVTNLAKQLAEHYLVSDFLQAKTMGELVKLSLNQLHF